MVNIKGKGRESYTSPVQEIENLEKLLQLEQNEDLAQYQAQILETPLKERQRKGSTWYPVRVKGTQIGMGGKFIIELSRNVEYNQPHQFQPGAQAAIFWNAPIGQKVQQLAGTIISVDQTDIQIQILEDDLPDWIDERHIGIDLLFDENSYREMKFALAKLKNAVPGSRLQRIRDVVLGWEQAEFLDVSKFDSQNWPIQNLNDSQKNAIHRMVAAKDLFVIHGPPGTGKTTTIISAIKTTLLNVKQVLVCAPSNAAADLLTEKLAQGQVKVLRIGNPARISEEILPYTLDYQIGNHTEAKEIKRLRKLAFELKKMAYKYKRYFDKSEREQKQAMLKESRNIIKQISDIEKYVLDAAKDSTQAFVTTLVGASSQLLRGKRFEVVFIDEAGQALEPACWIPIINADKVVFAGDHCQLPPTVKSKDAARLGLEETLLEKILDRQSSDAVVMLDVQYRMHEKIMNFSSDYFYNGKLKAHSSVNQKLIFSQQEDQSHIPFLFIDTSGTGFDEKFHPDNTGLSNPEEAILLVKHLSNWLDSNKTHLAKISSTLSISIISPYREQVEFLKKEVQSNLKNYSKNIKIGTVDGFQGQEADLVYISLVRSNSKQEIGFLRDIRRMNVAITRARMRLVVIGDASTLSNFKFYKSFIQYVDSIGAYRSAWEYILP